MVVRNPTGFQNPDTTRVGSFHFNRPPIQVGRRLATPAANPYALFCIIPCMTETYESKRLRMQKALESLPANLRTRISLRNAEAAAALSPEAHLTLADALDNGLVKVARAIELLSQNPHARLNELLPRSMAKVVSADSDAPDVSAVSAADTENIPALTALIRSCYPDMPQVAAEALASAPAMQGLRAVLAAHEDLTLSSQFRTDFVVVTFSGFLRQAQESLDAIIAQNPAIQQALRRWQN